MDMSDSDSMTMASCKISMLWNWYTIDSCFLSSSWHNTTSGMFAGSVIGVFCLVISIEGVRRLGRDYDRNLVQARIHLRDEDSPSPATFVPSWGQQVVRSLVYGTHFTVAFLVMLLGMYYNGYILFAIFIGQTVGYLLFGSDTVIGATEGSATCC